MASIGLKMVYVGIKDADGKTIVDATKGLSDKGVYPIDTNKDHQNLGTKTANITALSGNPVKITGNNEVVDVTNPPSSPQVAFDMNAINPAVREKLLGRVSNGIGGYTDGDKPADCGVIIESQQPVTMTSVFFCFGRGNFNETTHNIGTDTDTAETRDDDTLTFTSLGYDGFGGKPFAIFYESDPKFDKQKMMDLVFPGQQLVTAGHDGTQDGSLHGGTVEAPHGSSDAGSTGTDKSNTGGNI
ncbi:phage tail protein [Limosilactobacillus antri]|uniref:phage tail protein n=1 Tax=Limosilactobacillus antri TaxID=227943 RepID=UPI001F5A0766|nr:phage tail protein [Limosilactobacillus antri]